MNCSFRKQTEEVGSGRYPNLLLLAAVPQLMHGAFISQPMQLKILQKVKDITANLGKDEGDDARSANDSLPAVIAYVNTVIEQQVSKIEQHQQGLKAKHVKQPEAKRPAADLKAVKDSLAMGKKRTYAQRAGQDIDKQEDSEHIESGKGRTVKVEPRK